MRRHGSNVEWFTLSRRSVGLTAAPPEAHGLVGSEALRSRGVRGPRSPPQLTVVLDHRLYCPHSKTPEPWDE